MVIVLSTKQRMLDSFCPIPKRLTNYSPILPLIFVNEASRTLIAKTKKQPITRAGGNIFSGPTFLGHVWVPLGGRVSA